jgi:hypothetical protein
MAKKPRKAKKSFQEKVQELMPEFVGEVVGLSVDQLNTRLATEARAAEWNEAEKKKDTVLDEKKKEASEAAAPYRDASKNIKIRSKYLYELIKEKGGA